MTSSDFRRKSEGLSPIAPPGARDPEYYEEESALLRLSRLLAPGEADVAAEVNEALHYPTVYSEKNPERFDNRGLEGNETFLPWIALVDALIQRGLAHEIDWKEESDEVLAVVQRLLDRRQLLMNGRELPPADALASEATHVVLQACYDALAAQDVVLASLDIDSDSYVLITVPSDWMQELTTFATEAGYRLIVEYN
ncbi:DUF6630 family protein [Paenibacillus daejeonensis]|uniref:DUF6630 family protein n=1 Tax=Paenibacillus daejeonensis TaxID=135193 RepID=UPI000381B8B5|nr:DUF6630 family protein [Paenibacillus daejeonensis]